MPMKLALMALLFFFSLPGHTVLIQVDGSGEYHYGHDPADPTFRFMAIYDTESPGNATSATQVYYDSPLSNFVVWSGVGPAQFNPTDRRFDLGPATISVADNHTFIDKADVFRLRSGIVNVNGIDDLLVGFSLGTFNLATLTSIQLPSTLDLADFENRNFFLAVPAITFVGFQAFQAGTITSLTFTPLNGVPVPETSTTMLICTGLFGMFIRRQRKISVGR